MDINAFEKLINEIKEEKHKKMVLIQLNNGKGLKFDEEDIKFSKIENGIFYCENWIIDISSIVAIGDMTFMMQEVAEFFEEFFDELGDILNDL